MRPVSSSRAPSPAVTRWASTTRSPPSPASCRSRRCWRSCSAAAWRCTTGAPRRPGPEQLPPGRDPPVADRAGRRRRRGFVGTISERTGEFLQIVNYNLRGSQYAIAGTVAGLEALEKEVEERRDVSAASRRSSWSRASTCRSTPRSCTPASRTSGRGSTSCCRSRSTRRSSSVATSPTWCRGCSPSTAPTSRRSPSTSTRRSLKPALADWPTWEADPARLGRALLIELLAWQFASPVRWIETQDLLFGSPEHGGLGMEQFVEIGVANAPTIANLASQTTKLPSYDGVAPRIMNSSRDAAVVFATDTPMADDEPEDEAPVESAAAATDAPAEAKAAPAAAPTAAAGADRPADLSYTAADATKTLTALRTKVRPDQIGTADTIEALCDGVSSRRNQLLVDLGAELSLGAIDGAAEADWKGLSATVTKLARTYSPFGPVLTEAVSEQLAQVRRFRGSKPAAIGDRIRDTWQLGPGWVSHVSAELAAGPATVRRRAAVSLGFDIDLPTSTPSSTTPCRRSARRRASRSACPPPVVARVRWSTPPRSARSPSPSPAPTVCSPPRRATCSASSASPRPR